MSTPVPSYADFEATLSELATLGMRAARVVVRLMEIEGEAAEVVASWLPPKGLPASLADATAAGQAVDAVGAAMDAAVPRADRLSRALDRVSRSVRRSVALLRRMQAGWPRAGSADDRTAMVRRHVARRVAEAILRDAEGEAAERLFDELAERLDEPEFDGEMLALPVAEVVERVCRDLGLALRDAGHAAVPGETWPADTG